MSEGVANFNWLAAVKDAVLSWKYLCDNKNELEALHRLVEDVDAKLAWEKLSKKRNSSATFCLAASAIGRSAVDAYLSDAQKRTQNEIEDAANEAAKLAKRLVFLIENNSTLRTSGRKLTPPMELASLDRILRGLAFSHKLPDDDSLGLRALEDWYAPEIEVELNGLQERDYPYAKDLTTSQAFHILNRQMESDVTFKERLKLFAAFAHTSANREPVVPRPKSDTVEQRVFAENICGILLYYYGSPNFVIVAGLVNSVFRSDVGVDQVKKWWKRN